MLRLAALVLVALPALCGCNDAFSPDGDGTAAPVETAARPSDGDAEASAAPLAPTAVRYVIHVSVDGLRPDAVTMRLGETLPAFTRLRAESAWTANARTDPDYRITLPNHTSQLTGRPVAGPNGHAWTDNVDPQPGETLHARRGVYVPSVFDTVHDHGFSTAAYVSKTKFSLYATSYDASHGAPDITGVDNGRAKIDRFVIDENTGPLVARLVADLHAAPTNYTFVHIRDADAAGHTKGWDLTPGSAYLAAIRHIDSLLESVLEAVRQDPQLARRTVVIVTADHGGQGITHNGNVPENYTIPFYVWGDSVPAADLYALNAGTRRNPQRASVPVSESTVQPVRNGDAANLALRLLGLPPVIGSTFGVCDPLRVSAGRRLAGASISASGRMAACSR